MNCFYFCASHSVRRLIRDTQAPPGVMSRQAEQGVGQCLRPKYHWQDQPASLLNLGPISVNLRPISVHSQSRPNLVAF
eukprot:2018847-Rhodomonas_salina.3